ncbi:hypothetical protein [Bauldia litoralis]|uniref:hypothetical protein n=1 Tax=Bauldia litoralis TaxID=665467 RepID=UPI0032677707
MMEKTINHPARTVTTPNSNDPDYDWVPPLKAGKRGSQCGKCGSKFDYDKAYGYVCPRGPHCPMGMG